MARKNARNASGCVRMLSNRRAVAASREAALVRNGGAAPAAATARMQTTGRRPVMSTDARPGRRRGVEPDHDRFAAVGTGGEHHAVRLDPHLLRRFEIE